jgi:hypothetical protein
VLVGVPEVVVHGVVVDSLVLLLLATAISADRGQLLGSEIAQPIGCMPRQVRIVAEEDPLLRAVQPRLHPRIAWEVYLDWNNY